MANPDTHSILQDLDRLIAERRSADPEASYVAGLLRDGPARISRKLGEEAVESVIAGLQESDEALVGEIADLWFHSLVLLATRGLSSEQVLAVLADRFGLSGLEEKRRRQEPGSA
ncbi:phosphoribosyl-ATP pyrophosphohydrolase [Natronospira proteinivora]|uniref:Phosphoribosyl-ATP pyrophosphatase n=1 Tax=Natronospira proteinivora TaxID=1807133 RepID=A0ABT1GAD9_9GAMM|nr:phosphoribosyl-ATP diphosphatase [Natronospira proteinivora]MCP1728280.1 phosphoribosyl-ATP pyrophosphohydrolase [Natronospira proteinivora]